MSLTASSGSPLPITILLVQDFAMIAFSSTIEPLREANWVAGRKAFAWKVVSQDGLPVRASNGLSVSVDGSIKDVVSAPMVIVCSSFDPHLYATQAVLSWLRMLDRKGSYLGGVETGAYFLAKAGLLDGCRATIHWENMSSFVEDFPSVNVTGRIFEIDGRRFTASGAAAAMDMMLHFITEIVDRRVAAGVAEEFIYNRIRPASEAQRMAPAERMDTRHPRLRRLLKFLGARLDKRLNLAEMAEFEGISEREVCRLFRQHLAVSPQQYHRDLRLRRAQEMIRQTDVPLLDVALMCGFASSSDFARCFKNQFGVSASEERRRVYIAGHATVK